MSFGDDVAPARERVLAALGLPAATALALAGRLVDAIDARPAFLPGYRARTKAQEAFHRDLAREHPRADVAALYRLAMLAMVERFSERARRVPMTPAIRDCYRTEFARIVGAIAAGTDTRRIEDDGLAKDLGLCSLALVPLGSQLAAPSGVPLRWLLGGARTRLHGACYLAAVLRGTRPTLELHTHGPLLDRFTPDERARCYVRLGQLLALRPEIRAMQASSWFYDPALARISPHLAYLRADAEAHGASFFRIGPEGRDSGALATSRHRRELYAAGRYQPTAWLLVWPRASLIAYAQRHAGLLDLAPTTRSMRAAAVPA